MIKRSVTVNRYIICIMNKKKSNQNQNFIKYNKQAKFLPTSQFFFIFCKTFRRVNQLVGGID